MKLTTFINERLHINNDTKSVRVRPDNTEELKKS